MPVITQISLQNFKFFRKRETFKLDGNHLLIYGENGSGKSSFYWSLYTLLECANKDKDDDALISKYFTAGDDSCLTNIFLQTGQPDYVESEIRLDMDDGNNFCLSATDWTIRTDTDAQASNYASEFLNYKMLFRIHDFVHSDEIDLFQYFVREVFPYVKFAPVIYWKKKFDGSLEDHETENAKQIWEFVKNGTPKDIIDARNGNPRFPRKREPEYTTYKNIVTGFKTELQALLTYINTEGNPILKDEFKGDFQFRLDLKEIEPFKITAQTFTPPEFLLKLIVPDFHGASPVPRPQSFLNEARLSALGLAMRFAILKKRLSVAKLKLALLDDFMISLDMNNRDVALNYVFDKVTTNYQTIILTHDRYFYEMAKKKIKFKGLKDYWSFYEMYEDKADSSIQPYITKSESYLEKAEKHLKLHEYEIAGNFLRKEAETICKEFLPIRLQYNKNNDPLDLKHLLDKCITYFGQNRLNTTKLEKLNNHRDIVLNASSHDSYNVPKFRNEIESCLRNIEDIRKTKAIPILGDGDILEFELTTPGGRVHFTFEIFIHDDILLIKEDGKSSIITSGMINYYMYKNGVKGNLMTANTSLNQLYKTYYKRSDKTKSADFWEEVIIRSSGAKLGTLRKI